jgi:type IV pilus assembly protein PilA
MTNLRKKGFTLVELMIVVAIIGILAAIAIPNFIRFQARSKQAEAKTNLKAIFTGQKSRYGERDRYSDFLGEIGFAPERGNRYHYDIGMGDGTVNAAAGPALVCANAEVRDMETIAAAAGTQYCGVSADTFRYGANIVPTGLAGRGAVTWVVSVAGSMVLTADGIGYVAADCPQCDFSARAVGNIDNDFGGDEFFVASQFATVAAGPCAEAILAAMAEQPGSPINSRNDVNCD